MPTNIRDSLRDKYRAYRKALSTEQQQQASQAILQQCLQQRTFHNVKKVALYLANDGEVNTLPLIQYCWDNNIQTYLPVLHPFCRGYLLFLQYNANSDMKTNRYGIAEPSLSSKTVCPTNQLDVVFTPLVAFDEQGNRLGMGGGFYDRTLACVQNKPANTQVIGLAHDCQQDELLPIQPWDIPLAKIITPKQVFSPVV